MRYLILTNNIPNNIILANSAEIADLIATQSGGTARLLADDERVEFPESPTIPMSNDATINRHQAKIVLLNHGLLDTVNTLMENADPAMIIAWTEAPAFRRNSPTLLAMAAALHLDDKQVDALFAEALAVDV